MWPHLSSGGGLLVLLASSCCLQHHEVMRRGATAAAAAAAAGPTHPRHAHRRPAAKVPSRLSSTDLSSCDVDSVPPNLACPQTTITLLGRTVVLTNLTTQVNASDECGLDSITQDPVPGTVLDMNTTTIVNLTATDVNGNSQSCSVTVTVPPLSLLYQTSFDIAGGRAELQRTSFGISTSDTGLVHAITATLNKNLYYYSEVVKTVITSTTPDASSSTFNSSVVDATSSPEVVIQWRQNSALYAFDGTIDNEVPFNNSTNFTLTMSTNYIQSRYTVTYRLYGQRT